MHSEKKRAEEVCLHCADKRPLAGELDQKVSRFMKIKLPFLNRAATGPPSIPNCIASPAFRRKSAAKYFLTSKKAPLYFRLRKAISY